MKQRTIQEIAKLGGKARWQGKTKKQRREAMSRLGKLSAVKRLKLNNS